MAWYKINWLVSVHFFTTLYLPSLSHYQPPLGYLASEHSQRLHGPGNRTVSSPLGEAPPEQEPIIESSHEKKLIQQ